MQNEFADIPEEEKKKNLWRCDCDDDGEHIISEFHGFGCQYVLWLMRKWRDILQSLADDED